MDGGFDGMFGLFFIIALIGAFVTMRRDWHAGTFFGRSKVDLDTDDLRRLGDDIGENLGDDRNWAAEINERDERAQTAVATPPAPVTVEERLAEIERLHGAGTISAEERERMRARVLEDVADG